MGKEVENLIKENTELMETKNALNIVKNDLIARVDELTSEQEILRGEVHSLEAVRAKMNEKISELEKELKEMREKLEEAQKNEEDDIPLAQRKRFTRVEMARVLMERNQYKEKLMELQEAIKWTEMIRAQRHDGGPSVRKRRGFWDLFSGLFTATGESKTPPMVRYQSPLQQTSDPVRRKQKQQKQLEFMDGDHWSEKRAAERKEQYKLVRAHVKKDESGRMQAYGWSIPAVDSKQPPVPVPVYCRPLLEKEPNLKIWCSAGVLLTGGRTKDGGFIVGGSTFYSNPPQATPAAPTTELARLDKDLADQWTDFREQMEAEWSFSSLVWVGASAHGKSRVNVIDAAQPGEILESFNVCSSHLLCMTSVEGARDTDYKEVNLKSLCHPGKQDENEGEIGKVEWIDLIPGSDGIRFYAANQRESKAKETTPPGKSEGDEKTNDDAEIAADSLKSKKDLPDHIKDGLSKYSGIDEITTVLPTMWMGSQSGKLYIHSCVSEWRKCLRCVKMIDAILYVVHYKGRVFVALANGTVAVFHRDEDGQWSSKGHHLISLGKPQHSVRCLTVVAGKIWCAYRNLVYVLNPDTLQIEHSFAAHPRKESQVRQLVWIGDGVWCSIRLDSTLRLYHAHTYQHMQDVDVEPYVSKMLGTSKLGFSFVRITALLVSSQRLWIGTGNGVIISVPLNENHQKSAGTSSGGSLSPSQSDSGGFKGPGGVVRVYADPQGSDKITPGSFIPYCSMSHAQLSFHGHKDAVKFFVAVPGTSGQVASTMEKVDAAPAVFNKRMMVVSGGDGYIDFRVGEDDEIPQPKEDPESTAKREMSHLIVWEVQIPG